MPYENFHAARLQKPSKFDKFKNKKGGKLSGIAVPKSIEIILGRLKGEDEWAAQALHFNAEEYTPKEAKGWLKENEIKYISFEADSKSDEDEEEKSEDEEDLEDKEGDEEDEDKSRDEEDDEEKKKEEDEEDKEGDECDEEKRRNRDEDDEEKEDDEEDEEEWDEEEEKKRQERRRERRRDGSCEDEEPKSFLTFNTKFVVGGIVKGSALKSLKKELSLNSEEYYQFKGYASTFGNRDRVNDVVVEGAFKRTLQEFGMPKLCWQHDVKEIMGTIISCKEDSLGLYFEGIMPKGVQRCDEAYKFMKMGAIDSTSIGYSVKDYEYSKDGMTCILKDVDLYEVSLVTIPANAQAKITEVKNKGSKLKLKLHQVQDLKNRKLIKKLSNLGLLSKTFQESLFKRSLEEFLVTSGHFSQKSAKFLAKRYESWRDASIDNAQRESVDHVSELKTLIKNLSQSLKEV